MEIKCQTSYDLKAFKALTAVSMCKKRNPRSDFSFKAIFAVVESFALLALYFFLEQNILFLVLMLCVIAATLINFYLYFISPKKRFENYVKKNGNVSLSFTFRDSDMSVSAVGNGISETSTMTYDKFEKIFESSEYLFLYVAKTSGFIINKDLLSENEISSLRSTLSSIHGKKYKICNY